MATNDFLPFATGSGANVMSQADWNALAQRVSGFQSGVAQSPQLNKAWRQSSIMAAVLGQFIADYSGQNAVDDGTTAALEDNLKKAFNAAGITAPQFDNSTNLATTAFVNRVGLRAVLNPVNSTTTLTAANLGQSITCFQTSSITITLPSVSASPAGSRLEFFNYGLSGTVTVHQAGADAIVTNNGASVNSIVLNSGDTLVLESLGSQGIWYAIGGSAQLPSAAVFSGPNWTTPAQFDNSTRLATTAGVNQRGIQASGVTTVTATGNLSTANAGGTVVANSASAITQTLPAASAFPAGARIEFLNINTGALTVARNGSSDTITVNNTTVTSLLLNGGDTLTLESNGANGWYSVSGTAQFPFSGVFRASLGTNGYQMLPSGLIVQWGVANGAGTSGSLTYPIAFTTATYVTLATASNTAVTASNTTIGAASLTGFNYYQSVSATFAWYSIGK